MPLQFMAADETGPHVETGEFITSLKFDSAEAVAYKQIIILNPGDAVAGVKVQALETGLGRADASQLGNRAVIAFASSLVSGNIGLGPISVTQALSPANLDFHISDGILQLSLDSFTWNDYVSIGALANAGTKAVYVKFNKNLLGLSSAFPYFTTRMVISNTSLNPITGITLTASDSNTTLSLTGVAGSYAASVTVGTIGAGSSATVYVQTSSIQAFPYGQLYASDTTNVGTDDAAIPFAAPGGRAYCTIKDVRDYLETVDVDAVTDDEEILKHIITFSAEIDRSTRRRFDVVTTTERYDGVGQPKLVLDNYPILSVQEVEIRNLNNQVITDIKSSDSNFSTELIIDKPRGLLTLPPAAFPFFLYPSASQWFWPASAIGPAQYGPNYYDYSSRFGAGISNVTVTYTYGFATPPEGIQHACMKLAVIEILKQKGASDTQGSASESIAGMSVQYTARGTSGGTGPFGHLIAELQNDVDAALTLYRQKRLRVI